jgi:iron(III) transport system ATP-binding protein
LAPEPKLLLLDEPFSSLDSEIKESLIKDLKAIVKARKISVVIAIHDLEEALLIADRLLFIDRKKLFEQELKFNKQSREQLWKEKKKIEGKLKAFSF